MPPIRFAPFLAGLAIALALPSVARAADLTRLAAEATSGRHFDMVNATFDSMTTLAIAPAGSGAFDEVDLGRPLQGGLTAITFDLPAGGCLRDFRVTFRDGQVARLPAVDVCHAHGLRLTAR